MIYKCEVCGQTFDEEYKAKTCCNTTKNTGINFVARK